MRLTQITAEAHPAGNRIDLAWEFSPGDDPPPGVRVVRREGTHPADPADGTVIAEGNGLRSAHDVELKGETVYYYTLFPFRGSPPRFEPDAGNRVAAMATSPYDFAGRMYQLLPEIYRRFDAVRTPPPDSDVTDQDRERGVLRRFLDLPGSQFDQLYSLSRAVSRLTDTGRADGRLLPLLAHWIGWQTNFGLPVAAQRDEIRHAPRLYRTIGIVPTLEATVARVTGWPSRTKEFVHNVARTNQPERLNLWSAVRDSGGTWSAPVLASQNFAYQGRPAAVRLSDGSRLLAYHTFRRHGWDIWAKRFADGAWQPSEPMVDRPGNDRHPAVAMQGDRLWLFWEISGPRPGIAFRTRTGKIWSPVEIFRDPGTERRLPSAAVDRNGGLWLFWQERTGSTWQIKYNRHDGTGWQRPTDATLPSDSGPPRLEDDLVVFPHPTNTAKPLWLFWARHEPVGTAGRTRWTITYRSKQSLDVNATDWSARRTLPQNGPFHDREPAPIPAGDGGIELFWSSTRAGGWSIFRSVLDMAALIFGDAQQITTSPYTERAPLAQDLGAGGTLLVFRSNESLAHTSTVYGATRTLDMRYAGTTTADTGGTGKLALRGRFEDFQTYTYDAGSGGVRTNDDRISRDTVGLYLTPTITDPDQIRAVIAQLREVLADFMPIAARAIFITR